MANNSQDVILPTADMAGSKLATGDGAGRVNREGNYEFDMIEATVAPASTGNGVVFKGKAVIRDEDEAGKVVYINRLITGEYKKGEQTIKRMDESFGRLLLSIGKSDAFVAELVAKDTANVSQITRDEIVGKRFYGGIRNKLDDQGRVKSECEWYISKEKYDKSKASGAGFRLAERDLRAAATTGRRTAATPTVTPQMEDEV